MKIKIFIFLSLCLLSSCLLQGAKSDAFLRAPEERLLVNNRILAQINGTPITTYDVMKKMDMIFLRHYPEYASSVEARFQFYQVNWQHFLQELINKELV